MSGWDRKGPRGKAGGNPKSLWAACTYACNPPPTPSPGLPFSGTHPGKLVRGAPSTSCLGRGGALLAPLPTVGKRLAPALLAVQLLLEPRRPPDLLPNSPLCSNFGWAFAATRLPAELTRSHERQRARLSQELSKQASPLCAGCAPCDWTLLSFGRRKCFTPL